MHIKNALVWFYFNWNWNLFNSTKNICNRKDS